MDAALSSRASSPGSLVRIAREYDRKGQLREAVGAYQAAVAAAELSGDRRVGADALRRLAVVYCRRQENATARALCARSEVLAREAGDDGLVAEALNTAGGIELLDDRLEEAEARFLNAAAVARDPDLLGRIEQNLATVASSRGDVAEAMERYRRSLAGFEAAGNRHGCAVAYHNLGVASNDLRRWAEAERHLRRCLQLIRETGDLHLRGLAAMNHAHALAGLGRLREARVAAETATSIFDELHAPRELADAYWVLGAVLRRSGELGLAQLRLRLAIEVAATSRCALGEAEATRELALVMAGQRKDAPAYELMAKAAAELDRLKPGGPVPASVRAWSELVSVRCSVEAARAEELVIEALRAPRPADATEAAVIASLVCGEAVTVPAPVP
jgi:tetratricopeptide (TPR) repeat protein